MSYTIEEATNQIKLAVEATPYSLMLEGARFPDLLFHYTNVKGLHGILSSRTLWATAFQFLNDKSEHLYGQDRLLECLRERNDQCTKVLCGVWPSVANKMVSENPHYVASTCEDGDSVSQWRGYANMHDGYAIAFRRAYLEKTNLSLRLLPLLYSHARQERFLGKILDASLDAYQGVRTEDQGEVLREILIALQFALYNFKDPSFTGEKEWRVVAFTRSSTPERFRVVGGQIVPYVEIPLDPGDIDHIVQGPGSYREASGAAISRFASGHGFNGVTVKRSQVPIG
jgi:hypothetical protein